MGAMLKSAAWAIAAVSVVVFSVAASAHPDGHATRATPPWQAATSWPDRIVTTLPGDPATSFAVNWRTDDSVGRTLAQIAPASPDARFDLGAVTVRAQTERVELAAFNLPEGALAHVDNQRLRAAHYHAVTFAGLEPDTLYAWRVQGARGNWSEWIQTRTAPREGPIAFLYSGDAQQGARSHWSRIIRMAHRVAPDARFFLHAGDLTQQGGSDYDWAQWFSAGGFLHAEVPALPVIGNHEHIRVTPAGGEETISMPTPLWRPQFTLPIEERLPESQHEYAYQIRYTADLEVFVLNSTSNTANVVGGGFEAQAQWLEDALKRSDARWKIVAMHHPFFLNDGVRRQRNTRGDILGPVIENGDVDLVLAGHRHHYERASEPVSRRRASSSGAEGREVGAMMIISTATPAQGDPFSPEFVAASVGDGLAGGEGESALSIDRVAENTPMFQVIRIDADRLSFQAVMANGQVYDAFTLVASGDGPNRLIEGPEAAGAPRLFENTGPFRRWYDLQ